MPMDRNSTIASVSVMAMITIIRPRSVTIGSDLASMTGGGGTWAISTQRETSGGDSISTQRETIGGDSISTQRLTHVFCTGSSSGSVFEISSGSIFDIDSRHLGGLIFR